MYQTCNNSHTHLYITLTDLYIVRVLHCNRHIMHVVTVMIMICIVNISIIMLWCEGYSSSSQMDVTMPVAIAGSTADNGAVSQLPDLLPLHNTGKYILHLCYKLLSIIPELSRWCARFVLRVIRRDFWI